MTRRELSDSDRAELLIERLQEALERPLTSPGSHTLAEEVFGFFNMEEVWPRFAQKMLQTLRDGQTHSMASACRDAPHYAVQFVAWSGTHREAQPERIGQYLNTLCGVGAHFVKQGMPLAGILEVDAYVRESPHPEQPDLSLEQIFEIDVEYSYLPGWVLGGAREGSERLRNSILLNPELCSAQERATLEKLSSLR